MATIDASEFWGAAPQAAALWSVEAQSATHTAAPHPQPPGIGGGAETPVTHDGDRFLADLQSQLKAVMRPVANDPDAPPHAQFVDGATANVWAASPPGAMHAPPPPLQPIPQLQHVGFSVVGQQQPQQPQTLLTPPGMAMYLIPGTNQLVLLPTGGSPPQVLAAAGAAYQHHSPMGPSIHSGSSAMMAVQFPSIPSTPPSVIMSQIGQQHGTSNNNNNQSRRQRNSRGGRNSGGSSAGTLQSNGSGVFPMSYQPSSGGDSPIPDHQSSHKQPKQTNVAGGPFATAGGMVAFAQPRELGNRPNHNTNVHDSLAGKCSFHAYRVVTSGSGGSSTARRPPKLLPATSHNKDQSLPIFVQMFPSEWIQQAHSIFQEVVRTICGPTMPAVVESMDMRSETSFIAVVRTAHVWDLIARLRCRVLMDRHGYWYANDGKAYQEMKDYCDTVRRLPQQQRHCKTDGLPCMPLVVELGRSASTEAITAPYAAPFDALPQMGSPGSTATPSGSDMVTGASVDGSPPQFFTSPPMTRSHGHSSRRSQRHSQPKQQGAHQHHHHHGHPQQHMLQQQQQHQQFFFQPSAADFSSHVFLGVMDHQHHVPHHSNVGYVVDQRATGRGYTAHGYSPSSM